MPSTRSVPLSKVWIIRLHGGDCEAWGREIGTKPFPFLRGYEESIGARYRVVVNTTAKMPKQRQNRGDQSVSRESLRKREAELEWSSDRIAARFVRTKSRNAATAAACSGAACEPEDAGIIADTFGIM